MKVGDKFFTQDGAGYFYHSKVLIITEIENGIVSYRYLRSLSPFSRPLRDFEIKLEFNRITKLSPVTELFYDNYLEK
jgi:hypothetical protein